jgi:excisionase family DNA binding protein
MKNGLLATTSPAAEAQADKPKRMARDKSNRKTVTLPEVGEVLGISRNAAYEAARRGEIPVIQIGKLKLVSRAVLDRILETAK